MTDYSSQISKIFTFLSGRNWEKEMNTNGDNNIDEQECRSYLNNNWDGTGLSATGKEKDDIIMRFWKSINTDRTGEDLMILNENEKARLTKMVNINKKINDYVSTKIKTPDNNNHDYFGKYYGQWKTRVTAELAKYVSDADLNKLANSDEIDKEIADLLDPYFEQAALEATLFCVKANLLSDFVDSTQEGGDNDYLNGFSEELLKEYGISRFQDFPQDLQARIAKALEKINVDNHKYTIGSEYTESNLSITQSIFNEIKKIIDVYLADNSATELNQQKLHAHIADSLNKALDDEAILLGEKYPAEFLKAKQAFVSQKLEVYSKKTPFSTTPTLENLLVDFKASEAYKRIVATSVVDDVTNVEGVEINNISTALVDILGEINFDKAVYFNNDYKIDYSKIKGYTENQEVEIKDEHDTQAGCQNRVKAEVKGRLDEQLKPQLLEIFKQKVKALGFEFNSNLESIFERAYTIAFDVAFDKHKGGQRDSIWQRAGGWIKVKNLVDTTISEFLINISAESYYTTNNTSVIAGGSAGAVYSILIEKEIAPEDALKILQTRNSGDELDRICNEVIEKYAKGTITDKSKIAEEIANEIINSFDKFNDIINAGKVIISDKTNEILNDSEISNISKQNAQLAFRVLNNGTVEFVTYVTQGGVFNDEANSATNGYFNTIRTKLESSYSSELKELQLSGTQKARLFNIALLQTMSNHMDAQYKNVSLDSIVSDLVKTYRTMLERLATSDTAKDFLNDNNASVLSGRTLGVDPDEKDQAKYIYNAGGNMTQHMYDFYQDDSTCKNDDSISITSCNKKTGIYTYNNTNYNIHQLVCSDISDSSPVNESLSKILDKYVTNYNKYINVSKIVEIFNKSVEAAVNKFIAAKGKNIKSPENTTIYGYAESGGNSDYDTITSDENCQAQSFLLEVIFQMETRVNQAILGS